MRKKQRILATRHSRFAAVAQRWIFIETSGKPPGLWTWRTLSVHGTIDHQSEEFEAFGVAVRDAIKKGFDPREDHWIVQTLHSTTHYERGNAMVDIPHTYPKIGGKAAPSTATRSTAGLGKTGPERPKH
jgi:hypothetical protein